MESIERVIRVNDQRLLVTYPSHRVLIC